MLCPDAKYPVSSSGLPRGILRQYAQKYEPVTGIRCYRLCFFIIIRIANPAAAQFFNFMGSLTISFQALSMVRITLGPILERNTN